MPAIRPDVTVIHAQKADRAGNVLIEGIIGVQKEAVLSAKRAVVTVEEIVDTFDDAHPNACILPNWTITAIAVVPGGAPEIAASCKEIFIVTRQSPRSMVKTLDFVTSLGHGTGGDDRARHGVTTKGPTRLITDMAVMEPDPETKAFTVTGIHPGVSHADIAAATGWPLRFADEVTETEPPRADELAALRALHARTSAAHGDG